MNIIGINAFGQNPAACIIIDGKLVNFSHEERFNRLKGSHGLFPSNAISWCLLNNNLYLKDINYIAFNWDCNKYPFHVSRHLLKGKLKSHKSLFKNSGDHSYSSSIASMINHLSQYNPKYMKQLIHENLRISGHKGKIPEIEFVDHHLSHAYQAYYQSSFKDSLVLVVDGHGEESCISGYKVNNDVFTKIIEYKIPDSLGWFYGAFTAYLGFNTNRDEGKLMGLAAYGEKNKYNNPWIERFDKLISVKNDSLWFDPKFLKFGGNYHHPRYTEVLKNFITSFDPDLNPIYLNSYITRNGKKINQYFQPKYIDLAFAAQYKLEQSLIFIVNKMVKQTGIKNLAYAGGVAMNCKANRAILDHSGIENIFIHPASSDDGSSIGSALFAASMYGESVKNTLHNVHLGPAYSNDEILQTIKQSKIKYKTSHDIVSDGAKYLSEGNILGWFQGGAEMGARALGGRSIVASLQNRNIKKLLNEKVKFRENWRPYCPSILHEDQDKFIHDSTDSPYMILAAKAKDCLKEIAPAIVHVDNTIRPQSVNKKRNKIWHSLISEQNKLCGIPMVLNTSFNVRGEPIVCSPRDAIRTFYTSGLDKLLIGNFIISK